MAKGKRPLRSRQEIEVGSLLVMVALGSLLALAVLTRPVYARYDVSATMGVIPAVLAFIFFGLVINLAGKGTRGAKPAASVRTGGILIGVGFMAAAGAVAADISFWAVAVPLGILVGSGAGLAFAANLGVVMRWFPEKRATRSGWSMAAFFIGGIIMSGVAAGLMAQGVEGDVVATTTSDFDDIHEVDQNTLSDLAEDGDIPQDDVDDLRAGVGGKRQDTLTDLQNTAYSQYNTMYALAALGVIVIVLCLMGASFLENPPRGWTPEGWGPADGGLSLEMTYKYGELIHDRIFIQLWFMLAGGSAMGLMMLFHMGGFGLSMDASAAEAGTMLYVFMLGGAVGAIIGGVLGDRLSVPTTLFFFFLFQAIMLMVLMDKVGSTYGLFWATGAYGAVFGAIMALFPAATADYFGTKGFVKNYGLLMSAMGAAALFGILLVALLVRDDGNYEGAMFMVTAPVMVTALLAFVTKDPEKKLRAAARREAMEGELAMAEVEVRARKKERKKKAKKRKRKKKRAKK